MRPTHHTLIQQGAAGCGQPTLQQPVVGGALWSYGNQWAALVREGQVSEVWVKRQPIRP